MLKNYKDLKVWQKSYQLCLEIYKITKGFPILLSGDLYYITVEKLKKLKADIGEVERMRKALIKSLENKHLNP